MYKLLLILKYLRRKLAPLFAALAVTLCTAMVIIVISVMGGFLEMMKTSVRKLTGDVTVMADLNGFPHYEELLTELRGKPEVQAATPLLSSYGLAKLGRRLKTVEIVGVEPGGLDAVAGFRGTLHWKKDRLLEDGKRMAEEWQRPDIEDAFRAWADEDFESMGMSMTPSQRWANPPGDGDPHDMPPPKLAAPPAPLPGALPGAVPGIALFNRRDAQGRYTFSPMVVTRPVTLTMLRVQRKGMVDEPAVRQFTVVNEFKSGLYEIDANRVFIGFDVMQKMLKMEPYAEVDAETGEPTGKMVSGRASEVMVRGKPGVPLVLVQSAVMDAAAALQSRHPDMPFLDVMTWQERHARFLGAVEKEKFLLTILFAIISVVAVAMIAVIFYMIVLEKTRDIGVLRAIGASRTGIASIFLGYGLAIGVVGAAMGLALSSAIVHWINEIQDFLAVYLGVTLFDLAGAAAVALIASAVMLALPRGRRPGLRKGVILALILAALGAGGAHLLTGQIQGLRSWLDGTFGFRMWDPSVYYFDRIPTALNPREVYVILIGAVLSSLAGSVIPAILAARLKPVEAIRYE